MATRLNQKLHVSIAGMERVNIQGQIPLDRLCAAMQNMSNYYRFGYTIRIEEIQVDKRPVTNGLSFNLPRHSVLYLVPYAIPGGTTFELYRNFKAPKGTMESAEEEKLFLKSVEYGILDVIMPGYRKDAAMPQNPGMNSNSAPVPPRTGQPENYQQAQPEQPRDNQQAQSLFSVPEPDAGFDTSSFLSHDTSTDNFFDDL